MNKSDITNLLCKTFGYAGEPCKVSKREITVWVWDVPAVGTFMVNKTEEGPLFIWTTPTNESMMSSSVELLVKAVARLSGIEKRNEASIPTREATDEN